MSQDLVRKRRVPDANAARSNRFYELPGFRTVAVADIERSVTMLILPLPLAGLVEPHAFQLVKICQMAKNNLLARTDLDAGGDIGAIAPVCG